MWHGKRGFFSFGFGFPPFFYFRGPRHFPKLEEYRDELKKELEQEELTQALREGY